MKLVTRLLTATCIIATVLLTTVQLAHSDKIESFKTAEEELPPELDERMVVAMMTLFPKKSVGDPDVALQHVQAAIMAANSINNEMITPYLLLGVARKESGYSSNSVSRLVCKDKKDKKTCKRKTGNWNSDKKGNFQGSYFCGVMQVMAGHSWKKCREFAASIELTYMKGAEELQEWWDSKPCKAYWKDKDKRLVCSTLGYAGGFASIKRGMSNKKSRAYRYSQTCIGYANRIERATTNTIKVGI